MNEPEDATESVREDVYEKAHHSERDTKTKWIFGVALYTAIISVFAAISSMMASHNENEALISQIKASDQWGYYQAKGIKKEIMSSRMLNDESNDAASTNRFEQYNVEQEKIKQTAESFEKESEEHLRIHELMERGGTMFHVSIAIAAISMLTRRKSFWFVSICFAIIAFYFMSKGLV